MDKRSHTSIYYVYMEDTNSLIQKNKISKLNLIKPHLGITSSDQIEICIDINFLNREREQLMNILDLIKIKQIKTLIVSSITDLGDSFSECLELMHFFKDHKIRFISIDNYIDTDLFAADSYYD